jgi:hypothetical protein
VGRRLTTQNVVNTQVRAFGGGGHGHDHHEEHHYVH